MADPFYQQQAQGAMDPQTIQQLQQAQAQAQQYAPQNQQMMGNPQMVNPQMVDPVHQQQIQQAAAAAAASGSQPYVQPIAGFAQHGAMPNVGVPITQGSPFMVHPNKFVPTDVEFLKNLIPMFLLQHMYTTSVIGLWGVFHGATNFKVTKAGLDIWSYDITLFLVVLLASSSIVHDPVVVPLSWCFLVGTLVDQILRYLEELRLEIQDVKILNTYSSRMRLMSAAATNVIGMLVSGWVLNFATPATFHNVPTQIVGLYGLWQCVISFRLVGGGKIVVDHYNMTLYLLLSSLASHEPAMWLLSLAFFFADMGVTVAKKLGRTIPMNATFNLFTVIIGLINSIYVLCYVHVRGYYGISTKLVALYGIRETLRCLPNFDFRVPESGLIVGEYSPTLFMLLVLASFHAGQDSLVMWVLSWSHFVFSLIYTLFYRLEQFELLPKFPKIIYNFLNAIRLVLGAVTALWVGIFA